MKRKMITIFMSIVLCFTVPQGAYASTKAPAEVPIEAAEDVMPFADKEVEAAEVSAQAAEDPMSLDEAGMEDAEAPTSADGQETFEVPVTGITGQDSPQVSETDAYEELVGAAQPYSFTVTYGQTEARSMLDMVNNFRTSSDAWYWSSDNATKQYCQGLSKLTYDYQLEKVAMIRAVESAVSFSHTRPNANICFTAYGEQGYSYMRAGENLAAGQRTAEAAFVAWREDNDDYSGQGHRRSMLNADFNRIGIAHIVYGGYHYWVQEFAKSNSAINTTTADNSSVSVEVQIDESRIKSSTIQTSVSSIELAENGSCALPTASISLSVTEHWGGALKADANCKWSVGNTSVAKIAGSNLVGMSQGSTSLNATINGQNVTIPVTVNHVPVTDPAVAATCTKTGLTSGSHCSVCGTVITAQKTVAKKAHTPVNDPAVAATCTNTGLTEGSHCSVCGTVITARNTVGVLGHEWGAWIITKEPSYDSAGEKIRVCSRDSSHVEKSVIPKLVKSGFLDVQDPNHAYYTAIYWAADAGITKGYSDGTFGINRSCTRGEMMMFLWRYAGKPEPRAVSSSPFKDVPTSHAFYKAILWGSQQGITKGYSDGTFGINSNVTRGACMMFLWRLKGQPEPAAVAASPFKDVPKTHSYYKAILWGSQNKITNGYTTGDKKGTFGMNDDCTRGQIVTFLYRAK